MAFRGNPRLRGHRETYEYSEAELTEYLKCRADFEYWAEKYAKIATLDDGIVTIKLRGYQKRMIRTIKNLPKQGKRGMVVLAPRQCGKTTGIYLYILWLIIFFEYKRVAIIANKGANARKVIRDIKQAYEFLPLWMQPGVKDGGWSKGSIELENGSMVVSGSTTSDSIRGQTFHCLSGRSEVIVRFANGEVYKTTMRGLNEQDESTFVKVDGTPTTALCDMWLDMEVLTDEGWKRFDGCVNNGFKKTWRLTLSNGLSIDATDNHEFSTSRGWVRLDDLQSDDMVDTVHGQSNVSSIEYVGEEDVYDLLNVEDIHCFYSNGIKVHNCVYIDEYAFIPKHAADDFMKSVLPTILSGKSAQLFATSTPKGMNQFWRMWRKAEAGKGMLVPVKIDYTEVPNYTKPEFKKMIIETEGLQTWRQEFETLKNCYITVKNIDTGKIERVLMEDLYERLKDESK